VEEVVEAGALDAGWLSAETWSFVLRATAMPADSAAIETTLTTRWPTIGATGLGRLVGQLSAVPWGVGRVFTVGTLLAAATIPISLLVFTWQLMPFVCRRYRLTDRRVIIERGYSAAEEAAIELEAFEAIEVEVLPGQAWLRAGDLVFVRGGAEVFRLPGVPRPEPFRQTCLRTKEAVCLVGQIVARQAVSSPAGA